MQKKIIKGLALGVLIVLNSSCSKFLDKKPDDSYRELVSLNDLQAALDISKMNEFQSQVRGEAGSDDYFITDDSYNSLSNGYREVYTWTPFDYSMGEWAGFYRAVAQSNIVLEGLPKIERTASNAPQWDQVKGSALFYRAFCFLQLSFIYAKAYDEKSYIEDLGISLRTASDFNIFFDRANVKDTYERIIKDAIDAAALLPDHPMHVYRPSKAAAYALLARAYLSMRKYPEALEYTNQALKIKNDLLDYRSDLSDINGPKPFPEFNKEILFYAQGARGEMISTSRLKIDTVLFADYKDTDLRKAAFFSAEGNYKGFKGSYALPTWSHSIFIGLATDELYLIGAECLARSAKYDEARNMINELLIRRYTNAADIGMPQQDGDVLTFILKERRKELLMRAIRWSDIKRLNKEGANILLKRVINGKTIELPPNDNRYAMPIPFDIVEIAGMKQNPS